MPLPARIPPGCPDDVVRIARVFFGGTTDEYRYRVHAWENEAFWVSVPAGRHASGQVSRHARSSHYILARDVSRAGSRGLNPEIVIFEHDGRVSKAEMLGRLQDASAVGGIWGAGAPREAGVYLWRASREAPVVEREVRVIRFDLMAAVPGVGWTPVRDLPHGQAEWGRMVRPSDGLVHVVADGGDFREVSPGTAGSVAVRAGLLSDLASSLESLRIAGAKVRECRGRVAAAVLAARAGS